MSKSENNRIVRNTALLYFRMLFVLLSGLVSVRLVLDFLGAEDYGLYNVITGFVTFFSFFSSTMVNSCQRFYSIEIEKQNNEMLNKYFSTTLILFFFIGLVFFIFSQTLGLWFVQNKLKFSSESVGSVYFVYQFAVVSFFFQIMSTPFTSLLLSYEKMKEYAYISIFEVSLKLLSVISLYFILSDRLVIYAFLILITNVIVTLVYISYCFLYFNNIRVSLKNIKESIKEVFTYSGWNLFGALSSVFKSEGNNIVLNIFYGTILNAARGVAYQVNGVLNIFTQNFMQAVKLQIIKYFAVSEYGKMNNLVCTSSKFSFYLVLILSLPLLVETPYVLKIWLNEYPDFSVIFTRLAIVLAIIDSLSYSIMSAILATGKIRLYQITIGFLIMLNVPLSYLLLKTGYPPYTIVLVSILFSILALFGRLFFYQLSFNVSIMYMINSVLKPITFVVTMSSVLPIIIIIFFDQSLYRFIVSVVVSLLSSASCIYYLGLLRTEKEYIKELVLTFIKKKKK